MRTARQVSLIDQVTNDSDQQVLGQLLDAWRWSFGDHPVTVSKLVTEAEQDPKLMEVLFELPVMDGRHINHKKLGWYLRKNLGRRANGNRIEFVGLSERREWRVVAC
jgi:putative DNA primase/helicase